MNATSLSIETLSGSATPSAENEDWVVYSTRRQDVVLPEQGGRAVAPSTHRKALPRPDFSRRVLRRLKGFLVEDQGSECKVAFVENNAPVFYYLPSTGLRNAGITAENQPFEMDEFESKNRDGSFSTGYTFRPLATSTDAFSDALNLDEGRRKKRDLILKKFGKTQD